MGCSCRWRSYLPLVRKRILLLQEQMEAPSQQVGFWLPIIEKTFWFQASVVYLGTITTRSRRRTTRAFLLLQAQTMAVGTEFIFYMVGMVRLVVVFLKFRKTRKRQAKSWEWTERPVIDSSLATTSDRWLSRIQFILWQMDRLQLTAVYRNRRRCVPTTPQNTRFRDVQQAIIMATVWIDDDEVCVVKPNVEASDTNDDVASKTNTVHSKRDTWQVSVHVVLLFCRHLHSLHTTLRGSSCARVSSQPCMKWASLFDFELSIPSNILFSFFIFNFPQLLLPFYFLEDSSNTAYSAIKEVDSTDESYLLTLVKVMENMVLCPATWRSSQQQDREKSNSDWLIVRQRLI